MPRRHWSSGGSWERYWWYRILPFGYLERRVLPELKDGKYKVGLHSVSPCTSIYTPCIPEYVPNTIFPSWIEVIRPIDTKIRSNANLSRHQRFPVSPEFLVPSPTPVAIRLIRNDFMISTGESRPSILLAISLLRIYHEDRLTLILDALTRLIFIVYLL